MQRLVTQGHTWSRSTLSASCVFKKCAHAHTRFQELLHKGTKRINSQYIDLTHTHTHTHTHTCTLGQKAQECFCKLLNIKVYMYEVLICTQTCMHKHMHLAYESMQTRATKGDEDSVSQHTLAHIMLPWPSKQPTSTELSQQEVKRMHIHAHT
jgi:hypothetical protein